MSAFHMWVFLFFVSINIFLCDEPQLLLPVVALSEWLWKQVVSCGIISAIMDHRELNCSNISFHVNMKFNFIFVPIANHWRETVDNLCFFFFSFNITGASTNKENTNAICRVDKSTSDVGVVSVRSGVQSLHFHLKSPGSPLVIIYVHVLPKRSIK